MQGVGTRWSFLLLVGLTVSIAADPLYEMAGRTGFDDALIGVVRETELVTSHLPMRIDGLGGVDGWERDHARDLAARRHAQWILDQLAPPQLGHLSGELERIGRRYTFVGEGAAIPVDSAGDPLIRDIQLWSDDEARWRDESHGRVERWLAEWQHAAEDSSRAALASIAENDRQAVADHLSALIESLVRSVRSDGERLLSEAAVRLRFVREQDTWSLMRKRESLLPEQLVDAAIREALNVSRSGDAGAWTPSASGHHLLISLLGSTNQNSVGLDEGLSAWLEAEQRMAKQHYRRQEELLASFAAGEAGWDEHSAALERERQAWTSGLIHQMSEGRRRWDEDVSRFGEQFHGHIGDVAAGARRDAQRMAWELSAILAAYHDAHSFERFTQSTIAALTAERERLRAVSRDTAYLDQELLTWHETQAHAASEMQRIERSLRDEAERILSERDRFDPAASERIRLAGLAELLDHQIAVASAVADYATRAGVGRERDAVTREALAVAQNQFDGLAHRYHELLREIDQWGARVTAAQDEVQRRSSAGEDLQREAEAARSRYEQRWEIWYAGDPEILERARDHAQRQIDRYIAEERPPLIGDALRAMEADARAQVRETAGALLGALTAVGPSGLDAIGESVRRREAAEALSGIDGRLTLRLEDGFTDDLALHLLAHGFSEDDDLVSRLLDIHRLRPPAGNEPELAVWRDAVAHAIADLVDDARSMNTEITLTVHLLTLDRDDPAIGLDESGALILEDAEFDAFELSILHEIAPNLFDLVPAWAAGNRRVLADLADELASAIADGAPDNPTGSGIDLLPGEQRLAWESLAERSGHALHRFEQLLGDHNLTGTDPVWLLRQYAEVLRLEDPRLGFPADQGGAMVNRLAERDRIALLQRDRVISLDDDIARWGEDRDIFFDREVAPALIDLNSANQAVSTARIQLEEAIALLDAETERATERTEAAGLARAELVRARRDLAVAQAVYDYAADGFRVPGADPLGERDALLVQRDRIESVLTALATDGGIGEGVIESGGDEATREILLVLAELSRHHRAQDIVSLLRERVTASEYTLYASVAAGESIARRVLTSLVVGGDAEPLPDLLELSRVGSTRTDSSGHERSSIYADPSLYEHDPGQLVNDFLIWVAALPALGDGVLRDFALAYRYERVEGDLAGTTAVWIEHAALGDQNFRGLVGRSEVHTDVAGVLNAAGAAARGRIMADQRVLPHYRFFLAALSAPQFAVDDTLVISFIEKDLARVAVDHVATAAIAAEQRLKSRTGWVKRNIFGQKPWRPIERQRQQMATFAHGGGGERATILELARALADSLDSIGDAAREAGRDGQGTNGVSDLERAISSLLPIGDDEVDQLIRAALRDAAEQVPASEGVVPLLTTLASLLAHGEAVVNDRLSFLVTLNASERAAAVRDHRQVAAGLPGAEQWAASGFDLFRGPSFSMEWLRSIELTAAVAGTAQSRAGSVARIERLVAVLSREYEARAEALVDEHVLRLTTEGHELLADRARWEASLSALLVSARTAWADAEQNLATARREWRTGFSQGLMEEQLRWDQHARQFARAREEWILEAARKHLVGDADQPSSAASDGTSFHAAATSEIAALEQALRPHLSLMEQNSVQAVQLDRTEIDNISHRMESLNRRTGAMAALPAPPARGMIPANHFAAHAHASSAVIAESVRAGTSRLRVQQVRRTVDEAMRHAEFSIERANWVTGKRFADLLTSAGFTAGGEQFSRRVVVDRSLFGGERRETQRIDAFRRFTAPEFISPLDLSEESASALSAEVLEALVHRALETVTEYFAIIFGRTSDDVPQRRVGGDIHAVFAAAIDGFERSAQFDSYSTVSGLFAMHVGYAPVMSSRDPGRIDRAGYGEAGRIMAAFAHYEARQSRGITMLEAAAWDLPLWDSGGSWLEAPTIRTVAAVGVSIAGAVVGQPWVALALTAANQATFAAMDTGIAGRDAEATWARAAQQVVVGAVSTATGGLFHGFGENAGGFLQQGLSGVPVGGSAIGSTWYGAASVTAAGRIASGTASAAVLAVHATDPFGGNGFDQSTFRTQAFGTQAVAGYVAAGSSSAVGGALASRWTLDAGSFAHLPINTDFGTDALARFAGDLAGEAGRYAVGGTVSVNLLNIGDLGATARHGLLELGLSSEPSLRIGGGGADVGAGRVVSVARAMDGLFELKRTQADVDAAMELRDAIDRVAHRALLFAEAEFSGRSGASALLADDLQNHRRERSRENVDELFLNSEIRNRLGDEYADRELRTVVGQEDLPVAEFMSAGHFDSRGSFLLAYELLEQERVTLEALFAGGKAYAGDEFAGSQTYEQRLSLFLHYFANTIDEAERSVSVDFLFGGMIVSDRGRAGGPPVADGAAFIERALAVNRAATVPHVLESARSLPELVTEYLRLGASDVTLAEFTESIGSLRSAGFLPEDSLYDALSRGNPEARARAQATVRENELAFLQARRFAGGESPGAVFTNLVRKDDDHYLVEVGYSAGRIHEVSRQAINAEHFFALELEHVLLGRVADTFCNLSTNEYAIAFGAPNLQYDRGTERTANMIHRLLLDGAASGSGRFVEVSSHLAGAAGQSGSLVIASRPNPSGPGHVAPVVGATWTYFDEEKRDYTVIPTVDNVGATFGTMDVASAFGGDEPQYFLWVPSR